MNVQHGRTPGARANWYSAWWIDFLSCDKLQGRELAVLQWIRSSRHSRRRPYQPCTRLSWLDSKIEQSRKTKTRILRTHHRGVRLSLNQVLKIDCCCWIVWGMPFFSIRSRYSNLKGSAWYKALHGLSPYLSGSMCKRQTFSMAS